MDNGYVVPGSSSSHRGAERCSPIIALSSEHKLPQAMTVADDTVSPTPCLHKRGTGQTQSQRYIVGSDPSGLSPLFRGRQLEKHSRCLVSARLKARVDNQVYDEDTGGYGMTNTLLYQLTD